MEKNLEMLALLEAIFRNETKIDNVERAQVVDEHTLEITVGDKTICFTIVEAKPNEGMFFSAEKKS
ncbi:MAG: hypothetical protein QM762_12360 [Chryseolinea sp.]